MTLYGFLGVATLVGLAVMGVDKRFAMQGRRRISERNLIILCLLGGSLGVFIGMYLWHHKTKKIKFYLGVPLILMLQVTLWLWLGGYI